MLNAEQLLELPKTKERLENYGDDCLIEKKICYDLAQTKNYRKNIYYHANGGTGEAGLGNGLYLGKDKRALNNFYNCFGGDIDIYEGSPDFLDLTLYDEFDKFESEAKKLFENDKECLKKLTIKKGYEGIRYYDPVATGEEFILYDTKKIKLKKKVKKRKTFDEIFSNILRTNKL